MAINLFSLTLHQYLKCQLILHDFWHEDEQRCGFLLYHVWIVTIWGLKASLSCLKLTLLLSFIFSVALTIYMGYIVQNLSLIRLQNLTGCIVDAQHNSSSLYEIISQFHNPLRTPTHESLRWASLFCTKNHFKKSLTWIWKDLQFDYTKRRQLQPKFQYNSNKLMRSKLITQGGFTMICENIIATVSFKHFLSDSTTYIPPWNQTNLVLADKPFRTFRFC